MARAEYPGGIELAYDDRLFSVAPPSTGDRTATARRAKGFGDERPAPIEAEEPAGAAHDMAQRLRERGVMARVSPVIRIGSGPAAPRGKRAAPEPGMPTTISVPVAAGEQAVVLVEGDGVLAWRFGQEAPASALAERRRSAPGTERVLVFDLGLPPIAAPEPTTRGATQRGWLRDRLVEGVKAIVLYFAAEATAAAAVYLLERKRRDGPVVINSASDASQWQAPGDFSLVPLPADRPARVLLLVHGTFSSTLGGFGELTVTPWGRRLLATALERYDAVLGFDHRTLALTPRENAQALVAALRTLPRGKGVVADAVCHSRGGLVLRSLIEHELPSAGLPFTIERAVFVAATNRGTELARPENWETLVDLVTNLSNVTARALSLFAPAAVAAQIADEAIDCIGDFVKYLVGAAVKQRRAPGLAAMDPGGEFIQDINQTQPGQPRPQDTAWYAVVSDFHAKLMDSGEHEPREMPKRLAFILADGVVDRLMRGDKAENVPNDLVVDVASMTDIDRAVGGYVREVLDFGHNPLVYHTNYFLRPETAERLAHWLQLPSPLSEAVTRAVERGVDHGLRKLELGQLREILRRTDPAFLAQRKRTATELRKHFREAVRPAESRERRVPWDLGPRPGGVRMPSLEELQRQARARSMFQVSTEALNTRDLARLATEAQDLEPQTSGAAPPEAIPPAAATPEAALPAPPAPRKRAPPAPRRPQETKSSPPPVKHAKPPAPEAPAERKTFVLAEMPREVPCGRQALVSVTLSAEQIEAAVSMATAQGETILGPGQVTVHVVPRQGYDYLGDGSDCVRTVDPPRPRAPVILDFTLAARDTGPGEVMVAVRQGAQRLLTLTLRSTIVAPHAQPAPGRAEAGLTATAGTEPECGLCATLEIFDRRGNDELRYEYILRAGGVNNRYVSDVIKADPKAYVGARYEEIQSAWTGSKSAIERFRVRLEAIGGTMFRQLFPPALKQALWKLAVAGELDDILVYSDEPFLPWEVVFLDDPAAPAATGRGKFFGELGLCRWLYGAVPICEIRVREGRARYVVPHYPDPQWQLPNAENDEEPMLKQELGATALTPSHAAVVQALSTPGSFDLLHFACHGAAESDDIDSAALLLEGELSSGGWAKESLLAPVVDQVANLRGPDGNRPLVVINACQTGRVGYSLGKLGGFAPAFLGAREGEAECTGKAGAFVGALWTVGDFAASSFVHELYRQLKDGRTMAQAVRAGRAKARDEGEGTWLAYTVYAHPHLRVRFGM